MLSRVRRRASLAVALAVAAIALVAAGCGGGSSSSSSSGSTTSSGSSGSSSSSSSSSSSGKLTPFKLIASGADTYPYDGLITVAQQKGWFKDAGIDLTVISSENGGGGVAQVLASGGANMGIGSGASAIPLAQNKGANIVLLDNWYPANDFVWLSPKPGVKLEGSKIGFTSPGSSTELMVKAMHAALPNTNFTQVPVGSPGAQWAAAKAGKIDAAWELPPFTEKYQAEDNAHLVVAGAKVVGDLPADFVYANRDYIKAHPDVIRSVFKVFDKMFTYARNDPAAAAQDLSKVINVKAKYIEQAIKTYTQGYTIKLSPEALKNQSKVMVSTHTIDQPVDWKSIFDTSYLPKDAQAPLPAAG